MLTLKCTGNLGFSYSHEGTIVIKSAGYMGSSGALPCGGLGARGVYAKLRVDCDEPILSQAGALLVR